MIKSEKEYREILAMARKGEIIPQVALALYKETRSEDLKELYLLTEKEIIKRVIMIHPNCPNGLKIVDEL